MTTGSMSGKVCLVTGCTSGIGKVTARELARMDATVVMLCRNRERGEAVQSEIKAATGSPKVELIVADLSQLSEVRRAAAEFKQSHERLDVLVNNAGGIRTQREITADGVECTFATNYLSGFLLTQLLMDELEAVSEARVINVSSVAHRRGKIDFADLNGTRRYSFAKAYGQSKLAQILFTYELANRLTGTGVTVNALHPGPVASSFTNGFRGIARLVAALIYAVIGISAEKGARTTLYLASSPEVTGVSGKYFVTCRPTPSSKPSYDEATRRRLWSLSEELTRQEGRPRPDRKR